MDVAVMYSGGKDSALAIEHCLQKGWRIRYVISVKPSRTDCYLFHFATVEWTRELCRVMGLKQYYVACDVADPELEAAVVKGVVEKDVVDAVVLGGTGLQESQIRVLRDVLFPLGVEVFAAHAGLDHGVVVEEMIRRGYDIRITQVAAEGLSAEWLGVRLDGERFAELRRLSERFGFHVGAEGGHYDTLVVDAPFLRKRLEIVESERVVDGPFAGHLVVKRVEVVEKGALVVRHR